jgi:hypothetical protein
MCCDAVECRWYNSSRQLGQCKLLEVLSLLVVAASGVAQKPVMAHVGADSEATLDLGFSVSITFYRVENWNEKIHQHA